MNPNEKKLSDYIDQLNEEKKPDAHDGVHYSEDMEELFQAVRLVKTLKEPSLPNKHFSGKLTHVLRKKLVSNKKNSSKRRWFLGLGSLAALFALVFTLNYLIPFEKSNIVYAMEKAFKGIKAYHGILQVVEKSADGKSTIQSKLDVWSDKEGRYYVKVLEGSEKGLITVNNGENKWQVQPDEKQVNLFPAFPDAYRFTFELGREITDVKKAVSTKEIGEDMVAGRQATILRVTPQGGEPYKLWIDQETKMPLQRQSAMQNSIQYKVTYSKIDFSNTIPKELVNYHIPKGYKEINVNPEQFLSNREEVQQMVGYTPIELKNIPTGFKQTSMAVETNNQVFKMIFTSDDHQKNIIILQGKSSETFKPASNAILGKIHNCVAEIQSPIEANPGILASGGIETGVANTGSIRWQQNEFEYAVLGNTSVHTLAEFVQNLTGEKVEISEPIKADNAPKVKVSVDMEIEKNEQKSVDGGHSPWKLDPVFVSQVFVSLKISPEGITGDYPIKTEDLKLVKSTGKEAIVEVSGNKTPIRKVYLKRLIRQDSTGIWTVVGYDPK